MDEWKTPVRPGCRTGIGLLTAWLATTACLAQGHRSESMIDIGGRKLQVHEQGTATPGMPTVVFENGLGMTFDSWAAVQAEIAKNTRTVAYNRAGLGRSEPSRQAPSPATVTTELHRLLTTIGAPPPYVLVGHSYGGPFSHAFAVTYPKEIAGLVYVDPTDFTQTAADLHEDWAKAGAPDGAEVLNRVAERMLASAPSAVRAEFRESTKAERSGFAEYGVVGEPASVPMAILLAGKLDEHLPPGLDFPAFPRFMQAQAERRLSHFGQMARRGSNRVLVLVGQSGHFIQTDEPETVVWSIRRVLAAVTGSAIPSQSR